MGIFNRSIFNAVIFNVGGVITGFWQSISPKSNSAIAMISSPSEPLGTASLRTASIPSTSSISSPSTGIWSEVD